MLVRFCICIYTLPLSSMHAYAPTFSSNSVSPARTCPAPQYATSYYCAARRVASPQKYSDLESVVPTHALLAAGCRSPRWAEVVKHIASIKRSTSRPAWWLSTMHAATRPSRSVQPFRAAYCQFGLHVSFLCLLARPHCYSWKMFYVCFSIQFIWSLIFSALIERQSECL